jgi:BirA family transcriptional regulator, biotin operon repressor / biotin---[acetyl-CoA-carboxylase] ligase
MDFPHYQRHLDRLRGRSPWNLVVLQRVPSTNSLARRIAREYHREYSQPPRSMIVALEQTAGRGRRGRRWVSPPGAGIYATLLLPLEDSATVAQLPLLVAVALARVLNHHLTPACRLKWPNDLVVGPKKLGGLLIEAITHDDETVAMIGFGINYGAAPKVADQATTSVTEGSPDPPALPTLLWELVLGVDRALEHLGDAEWAVTRYRELSAHRPGDRLTCRVGGKLQSGIFRGLDEHGFLRLEHDGREERVSAGEVVEAFTAEDTEAG